jgi:hypothetical protein
MVAVPNEIRRREARTPVEGGGERALRRAALAGYALTALAVGGGWWLTRSTQLVESEQGFGYWLGIAGGGLMATLLLYPLRKRWRLMHSLGATRHWFRMHMVLGVLGPVLILYHCNFSLGSLNDTVALVCTLLVAASGLVGRYVYAKVHVDLDGHRATLEQLSDNARITAVQRREAVALVPGLLERLTAYDATVLEPPARTVAVLLLPLRLAFTTRWAAARLSWFARSQLRVLARRSHVVHAQRRELQASIGRFIHEHLRRVRRVAELGSYERMFSIWHVFHLPFFYMLVVAALIHVLAVHMY